MNWVEDKINNVLECDLDDDSGYSILVYNEVDGKWCVSYNPPDVLGGYLSSNLRIECGYGLANAIGLPDSCCFNTREEAIEIAERHQKLLVLQ
jgi:hypothetical protein